MVWYREGTSFVDFTEFCRMRYLIFLFPALFLIACQEAENQLTVVPEQLALRDTAGQKSTEILVLKKGEKVEDLGMVSPFETVVQLQGGTLQSPWIKVKTSSGQQGWVMASLMLPAEEEYASWLETKRLICYFGKSLTHRRADCMAAASLLTTDADVAAHYREAVALRDTFMSVLFRRAEPNETTVPLDYSWLRPILPGFIAQTMPNYINPFLFADYQHWLQIARQSAGNQDDLFFETCTSIFPPDSIESFFPAWKFQLDDASSASQLGSGVHLNILALLEKNLATGDLFNPEILRWKESILADIAGKGVVYWQPTEKILAELQKIIEAGYSCLEARDQMVLQTRLGMFEDPVANGIRVNMRSGE